MSEQEQIRVYKEYIAWMEERLLHSDRMLKQAMEMVKNMVGKIK